MNTVKTVGRVIWFAIGLMLLLVAAGIMGPALLLRGENK